MLSCVPAQTSICQPDCHPVRGSFPYMRLNTPLDQPTFPPESRYFFIFLCRLVVSGSCSKPCAQPGNTQSITAILSSSVSVISNISWNCRMLESFFNSLCNAGDIISWYHQRYRHKSRASGIRQKLSAQYQAPPKAFQTHPGLPPQNL